MSEQQYEAAVRKLKNEVAVWHGGKSKRGGRLPERFWRSATALVQHSSIEKVAIATGLSAEGLKKRSECLHVLTELAKVFHHDQVTREARMTPAERLKYHKQHSVP